MPKTIAIIGGSISGNKGSEAMVTSVINSFKEKEPDVEFIIFSPYYKSDIRYSSRYPKTVLANGSPLVLLFKIFPSAIFDKVFHLLKMPNIFLCKEAKLLKNCDILVDVAGISFSDGREIYLPFNILTIWPKIIFGGVVAKVSQACGPFNNRLNRICAHYLLSKCKYIAARGSGTVANLESIGLSGIRECPDVTFLLNKYMHSLDTSNLDKYLDFGSKRRRVVGICPSSVAYKKCSRMNIDYIDINAKFINYLIEQNYRVLMVPHSLRLNTDKLQNNDMPVIKRIIKKVPKAQTSQIRVVEEDLNSQQLRYIIGKCDFFVASRFHGMIASVSMKVPVLVYGWGHKYTELLDEFGLSQYVFDCSAIKLEHMVNNFLNLVKNENQVRLALSDNLPQVVKNAEEQINEIVKMLHGKDNE